MFLNGQNIKVKRDERKVKGNAIYLIMILKRFTITINPHGFKIPMRLPLWWDHAIFIFNILKPGDFLISLQAPIQTLGIKRRKLESTIARENLKISKVMFLLFWIFIHWMLELSANLYFRWNLCIVVYTSKENKSYICDFLISMQEPIQTLDIKRSKMEQTITRKNL